MREEGRLAHIAELAGGRSEAEEKAQEREKNGTSGVHGGDYFAPHDTNNIFFGHQGLRPKSATRAETRAETEQRLYKICCFCDFVF
jgi:hypothetical protein